MSISQRDLKDYCDQCGEEHVSTKQVIEACAAFICLVVLVGIMGWCSFEKYDTNAPTPTLTKEQIRQLTTEEMKRHTIEFNSLMEAQARGGK